MDRRESAKARLGDFHGTRWIVPLLVALAIGRITSSPCRAANPGTDAPPPAPIPIQVEPAQSVPPNPSKPVRRGWFGLPPLSELLDDSAEDESTYFPEAEDDPRQPDIRKPGPDTANFPNSPYTLRQGRFYLEVSPLVLSGPSNHSPATYNAEALLRFGLTDRTELRLFTNGLTAFRGFRKQSGSFGFSPLAVDFKMNFWKQNDEYFIPAVGLETFLQTNTGSAGFNQNTQVGINLLFDHALPYDLLFEWNIGLASDPGLRNTTIFEVVLQWAFQKEIFDGFDIFYQGYLNGAPVPRFGDGVVMGAGALWAPNRRIAFWGSYNFGVTVDAPTTLVQIGSALAF